MFTFRLISLGKAWTLLSLQLWVKSYYYCLSTRMPLVLNNPQRLMCILTKKKQTSEMWHLRWIFTLMNKKKVAPSKICWLKKVLHLCHLVSHQKSICFKYIKIGFIIFFQIGTDLSKYHCLIIQVTQLLIDPHLNF